MLTTALDLLLLRIVVPFALLTLWYVTWRTERRVRKLDEAFRKQTQAQANTLKAQNEYITASRITLISVGDVWRPAQQSAQWRVLSLDAGRIMLAGPDKASTVQYVTKQDLLTKWKLVKRYG